MREKLIELLEDDVCPMFMVFGDGMDDLVDYLIANGVTIPVRCKDCKHYVPFVEPYNKAGMCNRKMLGLIAEDDFCSYGEKREV